MTPDGARPGGTLLDVRDLKVRFRTEDGVVKAVDGVTFQVSRGETLGIVGESGCGKSVSLLAVMGLLPRRTSTVEGEISLAGVASEDRPAPPAVQLAGATDEQLEDIRGNRIAMIFQDPMTSLNPVLTVQRQIAEALVVHGYCTKANAPGRVVEFLDLVGIPDPLRRAKEYPHQLSGGLRQRVMIAMAMACEPELLIADEPTTALDVTVQAQVLDVLDSLRRETGMAMVLVTHDLGVVAGRCDRVHVMYAGRIVETASTDELYARPRMPYTLGLLHSTPGLELAQVGCLTPIRGQPPSLIDVPSGCPFHPRCDYAADRCKLERPDLHAVGAQHTAACHYTDRVAENEPTGVVP